jgi:hypothetical protein
VWLPPVYRFLYKVGWGKVAPYKKANKKIKESGSGRRKPIEVTEKNTGRFRDE